MTLSVVQYKTATDETLVSSIDATFDSATSTANTLVLFTSAGSASDKTPVVPSGWTQRQVSVPQGHSFMMATRPGTGTALAVSISWLDAGSAPALVDLATLIIAEVNGDYAASAMNGDVTSGSTQSLVGITPGPGIEALMLAAPIINNGYSVTSYPVGWTNEVEVFIDHGYSHRVTLLSQYAASTTSGVYGGTISYGGSATHWWSIEAYFTAHAVIGADFIADDTSGPAPFLVNFTDLSAGGTVTAWAWDFGDGGTSSSQNPSYTYDGPGTYTVVLVATIDGTDYTETKVAYIVVISTTSLPPPPPGSAVVEIYVTEAGAYRWDDATWDDAIWATSRWEDVTPQSIDAQVIWGSSRPELGILSQPNAESWALDIYDPDRVLDPANVSGPYYGSLKPGLPIRINHAAGRFGGNTIRTGIVESMGHDFRRPGTGYIRVTNDQSTYANAAVPHDTVLSDTLYARAADAIAAAGLPLRILDPLGDDPALVGWVDPGSDITVWDWIADAAQQVLWVPYFDRWGWLGFRDYSNPINRSVNLAAPELIGLESVVQYNGNYSRVIVHDDADVEIIRHVSAPYGLRTFTRSDLTPDAGTWADAVLADRAFDSLRWIPGEVYPSSAASVLRYAGVTAVEAIHVSDTSTDPIVDADVIVVGGEIRLIARAEEEADWRFTFQTTQNIAVPLAVTGSDPIEYVVRTGGADTEYLFPSQ